MSDLPLNRYFAAYLESVNPESGSRRQYIVLPPVQCKGELGIGFYSGKIVWWDREQTLSNQKPRWTMRSEGTISLKGIVTMHSLGWVFAEPIVVKTTEYQVKEMLRLKKTPYDLIKVLERKAGARGIIIQGPTSKPQVVTSPPAS